MAWKREITGLAFAPCNKSAADRLHSQLDFGPLSISSKVNGREKIVINPNDAIERSLKQGDIVRVFNDRGALLAGVEISSSVRSRVVQMATGLGGILHRVNLDVVYVSTETSMF